MITITEHEVDRIFQRNASTESQDIVVSGTYTGTPVDIEAKVLDAVTLADVTTYAPLASSTIAGGNYSGTIQSVPGWMV